MLIQVATKSVVFSSLPDSIYVNMAHFPSQRTKSVTYFLPLPFQESEKA